MIFHGLFVVTDNRAACNAPIGCSVERTVWGEARQRTGLYPQPEPDN